MDMDQPLPFFPESLPDETLQSRLSRYHVLSGNRTESVSTMELVGKGLVLLDPIVPMEVIFSLAGRLPGTPEEIASRLIAENTLLPIFAPFLGCDRDTTPLPVGDRYRGLGRIPKRAAKSYGESRLCTECLREDVVDHGIGYWHRAHQIPGVATCWKHGTHLLSNCPICRRPFARRQKLLLLPWKPCQCGWEPFSHTSRAAATDAENRYATFAFRILEADLSPIRPSQLLGAYRKKIMGFGFRFGSSPNLTTLREAMVDEFGTEFIGSVDPAFNSTQLRHWIRLTTTSEGINEMPLARHLLLSLYLFGDLKGFVNEAVNCTDWIPPKPRGGPGIDRAQAEEESPKLKSMRNKLRQIKTRIPNVTLDQLWKLSYATTDWLYQNDKAWLLGIVSSEDKKAKIRFPETESALDAEFALLIDRDVAALYDASGKPLRVTRERIKGLLPKKLWKPGFKERFPLVQERTERYCESYWHFSLRRLMHGILEFRQLQLEPTNNSLWTACGVHWTAMTAILEHFGWDVQQLASPSFDAKADVARLGITWQWEGPPGAKKHNARQFYLEKTKG